MAITFIPYNKSSSAKERGLNVSRARSHAARVSRVKKVMMAPQPQSPHLATTRTRDWCFGQLGVACSEVDGTAAELCMSCVDAIPTRVIMGGDLARSPEAMSALRTTMRATLLELFQRTICDTSLFISSMPTAVVVVFDKPEGRLAYQSRVDSFYSRSLLVLRKGLENFGEAVTLNIKLAMLSLCVAAILTGDLRALDVHVRGLMVLSQACTPTDRLESFMWYLIRVCGLCQAIETGDCPLFVRSAIPESDHWATGNSQGGKLIEPWRLKQNRLTLEGTEATHKTVHQGHFGSMAERADQHEYSYSASRSTERQVLPRDQVASWRRAHLMSERVEHCVSAYREAVQSLSEQIQPGDQSTARLNVKYNRLSLCLHEFCTAYAMLVHEGRQAACPYNCSVIIALQIHLILALGGLLSSALPTLCRRLESHTRWASRSSIPTTPSGAMDTSVLRRQCELWLLLTGVHASTGNQQLPNTHQWFRENTARQLRALSVTTEDEIKLLCSPFAMVGDAASSLFVRCAIDLAAICGVIKGNS